jgi:hypothetical protein
LVNIHVHVMTLISCNTVSKNFKINNSNFLSFVKKKTTVPIANGDCWESIFLWFLEKGQTISEQVILFQQTISEQVILFQQTISEQVILFQQTISEQVILFHWMLSL